MTESTLFKSKAASRIVIKPLELCLYEGSELKTSIDLRRVKSHMKDNGDIYIELDYDERGVQGMRSMTLKGVDRVNELFQDLSIYISHLS